MSALTDAARDVVAAGRIGRGKDAFHMRVERFIRAAVDELGASFHPDTSFAEYVLVAERSGSGFDDEQSSARVYEPKTAYLLDSAMARSIHVCGEWCYEFAAKLVREALNRV